MRGWLDHFFSIVVIIHLHLIDQIHTDAHNDLVEWINQVIPINLSNSSITSVTNITVPDIVVYPALYFIHEQLPTSDLESDLTTLKDHLIYVNKGLGKAKILSFIRGFSYVPKVPDSLADVSDLQFYKWIDFKLRDIWKSQIDSMTIMVIVFHNKPKSISTLPFKPCDNMSIIIWDYNQSDEPYSIGDSLMFDIFKLVGCFDNCNFKGKIVNCNDLFYKAFRDHDPDVFLCIGSLLSSTDEIHKINQPHCGKTKPDDVALSVCGNGLLEGDEYCDCFEVANCPRDCNPHTCLKQFVKDDDVFNPFLILVISVGVVIGFVFCTSLIFLCYFNSSSWKKKSLSSTFSSSQTERSSGTLRSSSIALPVISKKSKYPSKGRILIDPKIKKSKSKILLDSLPKIDLSIMEVKSGSRKGIIRPTPDPFKYNLDSKSSTLIKVGLPSEKTSPILDSQIRSPHEKSSTELLSMGKGDLKISSKLLGTKIRIDQSNLATQSKNQPGKK